jgi:uncharacterized RDD family membrane protein YckC
VEGEAQGYEFAGWGQRVAAQLIDQLLLAAAAVALGLIVGAASGSDVGIVVGVLVYLVGMLVYYTVAHGSARGQTVGKMVLGIAVRSDGGSRAGYGQAFGRVLLMWILQFIGILQILNFLWPLWDKKKQAWHDKVAHTIVVRA